MDDNIPRQPAPLGSVESHAHLLDVPPDGQLLYKMMTIENLLRSIQDGYLYFNRVDSYADFPDADQHDGRQLPADQQLNASVWFEKAPDFSMENYFDQSRARTYACCFSLENSAHIWCQYENRSEKGNVCVVFDFSKLRAKLNQTLQPGNAALKYGDNLCRQIFLINYGIIKYVEWDRHRANTAHLPNPIEYTYLKNEKYSNEKELRISLIPSTFGMGQFVLRDGSTMSFPTSLQMDFDFKAAIVDGTAPQILCEQDCDIGSLYSELQKLGILPGEGSDLPLHNKVST